MRCRWSHSSARLQLASPAPAASAGLGMSCCSATRLPQSKWPLMVAGCLRRVGRLEEALLRYRQVYRMCPTNPEALRYLVALSGVRRAAGGPGCRTARPAGCSAEWSISLPALPSPGAWPRPSTGRQRGRLAALLPSRCCTCSPPLQEFMLEDDVAKFTSEMERLERMQAAAAAAPATSAAGLPPGTALGRITAQRPPTSGGRPGALPSMSLPPAAATAGAAQRQARGGMRPGTGA